MEDRIRGFSINRNGFGTIPKSVMQDQELSLAAKAVYAYFCSFTGAGDSCFPSRNKICFDLAISKDRLGKSLGQLTQHGYIQVEQVKNNKGQFSHNVYTLPDIVFPCPENPDTVYPDTEKKDTKKNSSKTNNNTKKNSSNISGLIEKVGYGESKELEDAVQSYMEFRKSIKKPMTEYAVELMMGKLYGMTTNTKEAVAILQQSIMNGWQGIFPLKKEYEKKEAVPDRQNNRRNANVFLDMLDDEM